MSPVTDPYSADTPELLKRSLAHTATARIVMPDGETVDPGPLDGTLSFDDTRSPRVEARLTCRAPTDAALLERMDPRTGARLELDLGYRRPGGAFDVQTIADLCLRDRRILRPGDTMSLLARSDESLLIDMAPVNGQLLTAASTTAGIVAIIQQAFPAKAVTVTGATGAALASEKFDDRWDMIADLADRVGSRVYDDGLRNWFVAPQPVVGTSAHTLAVGTDGTIVETDAGMSRDTGDDGQEWGNAVFLVHEWVNASNVPQRIAAYRRVQTGPYAATTGNTKIVLVKRVSSITQANANAAADALVARTVTRGRSFTVSAISAYWLRPGMTVTVDLPLGGPELHLVSSVTFDLRTGLMRVTTRLPDNTGTIGA